MEKEQRIVKTCFTQIAQLWDRWEAQHHGGVDDITNIANDARSLLSKTDKNAEIYKSTKDTLLNNWDSLLKRIERLDRIYKLIAEQGILLENLANELSTGTPIFTLLPISYFCD